jgi:hypothetical protein
MLPAPILGEEGRGAFSFVTIGGHPTAALVCALTGANRLAGDVERIAQVEVFL